MRLNEPVTGPTDVAAGGIKRACLEVAPPYDAPGPVYSLLATACVTPQPHPGLLRVDPATRMQDYSIALGALVTLADARLGPLVVFENSGVDPEAFIKRIMDSLGARPMLRSIEVVSYVAPPRPPRMHYGYAEFQMIDQLMDHAHLLTGNFIKVAGRYRFPVLPILIDRLREPPDFLCDAQDTPAILGRRAQRTIDASLFLANRSFYDSTVRHLYRRMGEAPRSTHVENLIFDELRSMHRFGGPVCLRLPVNCEAVGVGGNGDRLDSWGRRVKVIFRSLARRFLPGVWL